MEALIVGKPQAIVIGSMRALLEPMITHWGKPDDFQNEALEVLAREGGGILFDEKESPAHLELLHRQVVRYRGNYFRPIENFAQLEHLYRELDSAAARVSSTFRQGLLWLACRIQQAAIEYLQSEAGDANRSKVLDSVEEKRNLIANPLADQNTLTLERIEIVLASFSSSLLGDSIGPFEVFAMGGHLLEVVRKAVRKPPELPGEPEETPENLDAAALIGLLSESVWSAEINEAKLRFSRLGDEEKKKRFNGFRQQLLPLIKRVAHYAPIGLEEFCQAIEATIFPYPEPVEFIRSFARSLHANASQSTIFDNIQTPQAVHQRYETLIGTKQGNPLTVEIAKEMALATFHESDLEEKKTYMREVDLTEEFGWPSTMKELIEQM